MKCLILFKARDENECQYTSYFSEKDYEVISIPPISFEFCNLEILAEKLKSCRRYSGIILTSPRCVDAMKSAAVIGNVNLKGCRAFVVGEKTDADAVRLGLQTEGKNSGSGKDLAEFILKSVDVNSNLLYPKSAIAADTVETILTNGGLSIDSIDVYHTVQHPDLEIQIGKLKSYRNAQIVFFSPSGVEKVLPLFSQCSLNSNSFRFYALGPTTEKALKNCGVSVTGVAEAPSPQSLLETLEK